MHCYIHENEFSVSVCAACARHICADCSVNIGSSYYCKTCVVEMTDSDAKQQFSSCHNRPVVDYSGRYRKSAFLTFLFSALPGLNYMYLGLMKRGLFFMTLFFVLVALIRETGANIISLSLFMLMCFCLFDGFRIRRNLNDGFDVPDTIEDVAAFVKRNKKITILLVIATVVFLILRRAAIFIINSDAFQEFVYGNIISVAMNLIFFMFGLLAIVAVCYIIAKLFSGNDKRDE